MGRSTLRSGYEEVVARAFFEKSSFGAECEWNMVRDAQGAIPTRVTRFHEERESIFIASFGSGTEWQRRTLWWVKGFRFSSVFHGGLRAVR